MPVPLHPQNVMRSPQSLNAVCFFHYVFHCVSELLQIHSSPPQRGNSVHTRKLAASETTHT